MIHFIVWIIVGILMGWAAGLIIRNQNNLLINLIVGILGSMIAGLLFGGLITNQDVFNLNTLVIPLLGAILLLAVVYIVRYGRLA